MLAAKIERIRQAIKADTASAKDKMFYEQWYAGCVKGDHKGGEYKPEAISSFTVIPCALRSSTCSLFDFPMMILHVFER